MSPPTCRECGVEMTHALQGTGTFRVTNLTITCRACGHRNVFETWPPRDRYVCGPLPPPSGRAAPPVKVNVRAEDVQLLLRDWSARWGDDGLLEAVGRLEDALTDAGIKPYAPSS